MQINIMNGIYVDTTGELRTSYPRNFYPIPKQNGVSKSYLRPAEGLVAFASNGPGYDRGGINWSGLLYRVMGSKLVYIDQSGTINIIGEVGNDGLPVTMVYSFTRLAILSGKNLFYYDGSALTQVTDVNLGSNFDMIWVDGYFMLTDGNSLIVTNLGDPTTINPLKYGSAEADPDAINCLLKLRNAPAAVNRYTIELYQDAGGSLFPFQRIDGAEVTRGALGYKCACIFLEQIAFLGSGKNEPPAVYMAINGLSTKISTREIDTILQTYSETVLSKSVVEPRFDKSNAILYVHLQDRTLVYDYNASQAVQEPVWFTLDSGLGAYSQYRAQFLVWCYNQWNFGDPANFTIGTFSQSSGHAYGNEISWDFGTIMLYNAGNGAIVHELELISVTGAIAPGSKPTIWHTFSTDGVTWSVERPRSASRIGQRTARLNWLQCGNMRSFRIEKFRGTSSARIAPMALEARLEALND
jgi:hypothetical protein